MNPLDAEEKSASEAVTSNATNTRLSGPWLIIARAVWLVLVIPNLVFFVVSIPAYYEQLLKVCTDSLTCSVSGALTTQGLQQISTIGLSTSGYAALLTIFFVITNAISYGVGFLIAWRRSDDWVALLAAFFLVMANGALTLPNPILTLPLSFLYFIGQVALAMFFLLFPGGRFAPRWMGLILVLFSVYLFLNSLPSKGVPFSSNWPGWLYGLINFALYGAILFSQIYRYRRVSTPIQRQQTKWIVLGVSGVVIFYLGLLLISILNQSLSNSFLFNEVWAIIFPFVLLLIPLSIGFSILRYRLYDIDLLINRTLVYATLTVILALIYFGSIVGLQALLRGIINANSSVAIVVSTLVIAAIFQPLRHRVQAIIDRRFYRRKYDAARTIAAFSATLRNEVELSQLSEHLVSVVEETMQPKSISLWLRPAPGSREKGGHNT